MVTANDSKRKFEKKTMSLTGLSGVCDFADGTLNWLRGRTK